MITTVEHVHEYEWLRGCGAEVCWVVAEDGSDECRDHKGLARCYCGWSASGGNGRQELLDMGENLDDDY
jgi:hypothetical protein